MEYFIFDTETSGLPDMKNKQAHNPYEVIQLAGFRIDEDFNVLQVVNIYCNISHQISEGAYNVHGIDNKTLLKLSKGKTLEDYLSEPEYSWLVNPKDIVFLAYNVDFDKKMVNDSLTNNGYAPINFGREVNIVPKKGSTGVYNMCLCKASKVVFRYPRYKKLTEIVETKLPYNAERMSKYLARFCEIYKVEHNNDNFHDALYDSLALLLLFNHYKKFFRR